MVAVVVVGLKIPTATAPNAELEEGGVFAVAPCNWNVKRILERKGQEKEKEKKRDKGKMKKKKDRMVMRRRRRRMLMMKLLLMKMKMK